MWHVKITRDLSCFTLGAMIVLHELFLPGAQERPFLLTLAGALLGLPFVLRGEERIRDREDKETERRHDREDRDEWNRDR